MCIFSKLSNGSWAVIGTLLALCHLGCGGSASSATGNAASGNHGGSDAGKEAQDKNGASNQSKGGASSDGSPAGNADGVDGPIPDAAMGDPDPVEGNEPSIGQDALGPEDDADFSKCPVDEPDVDAECGGSVLWCTYGDSVRVDCRATYYCATSGWKKMRDCVTASAGLCPAAPTSGDCSALASEPADKRICDYVDGTLCACKEPCSDLAWCWECIKPPTNGECPAIAPNYGDPCVSQGETCEYGNPCHGGARRICREGIWVPLDVKGCGE